MNDEITDGEDRLGVLLMGHPYNAWWTGSLLSIHEARRLAPHQNATTLQVACSLLAAVMWMIRNPRMGVNVPDDLPHEEILRDAPGWLAADGVLVLEHAPQQAESLRATARDAGFAEAETVGDLAGRDRVLVARLAP